MISRLLKFIGLLMLVAHCRAAVKTALDREHLMSGESASLQIICEGFQPRSLENFPSQPNLSIKFAGQSQQFRNDNGQQSFSIILNYQVTPRAVGQYVIPSIKITGDGQTYETEAAKLTVTDPPAQAGVQEAFARLLVARTNVYVGEVFPIEIQLYVTGADQLQLPVLKSDGFIIQKQAPYTQGQSQVGNMHYRVLSFKSSISAAKAGDLALGPGEMNFNLVRRLSDDFFARVTRRPVTIQTETHMMKVRPLPSTNVPAGFSGGIGSFAMQVEASPLSITAGDPVTLKITVAGNGNLDALQLPKFNWPGFRFYDPTAEVISNDPLGIQGTKKFEQVIIPESAEVKSIPEIVFSFFDPVQQKYRSLSRAPLALQVRPGTQTPSAQIPPAAKAANPADDASNARDIVHIKNDPGAIVAWSAASFTSPIFLMVQALPLIGFVAAVAYRRHKDRLDKNPRLRRRMETEKFIHTSLQELGRLAARNDAERFYELLFRMLQEQLGERLDLPSSSITEAVVERELPKRKAAPEVIAELHALFAECNQARYAGSRPVGHLQSLVPRVRNALTQLQQLPS